MKRLVIVLIALAVLGCAQQNQNTGSKTEPFIGGTTGVLVRFASDSPPTEVDDGGDYPFDVVVELRNVGEFTVPKENVEVRILGIRAEEFSKSASGLIQHPDEDLISTKKAPEGDIIEAPPVYVTFSDFNHKDQLVGNKEFTLRAEACYKYQTTAMAQLCVRRNNIDPEEGGVCEVSQDKTVYNSGGPVVVTAFKEFGRAKDKVGFQFTVQHMSNGYIHEKGSTCGMERKYEDKVWIDVESQIDGGLSCSGLSDGEDTSGYVKMYGEGRVVSCTQQISSLGDYETPIVVRLSYDYRDDIETKVLVKHIPGEE